LIFVNGYLSSFGQRMFGQRMLVRLSNQLSSFIDKRIFPLHLRIWSFTQRLLLELPLQVFLVLVLLTFTTALAILLAFLTLFTLITLSIFSISILTLMTFFSISLSTIFLLAFSFIYQSAYGLHLSALSP
jgi:hypothetical protein